MCFTIAWPWRLAKTTRQHVALNQLPQSSGPTTLVALFISSELESIQQISELARVIHLYQQLFVELQLSSRMEVALMDIDFFIILHNKVDQKMRASKEYKDITSQTADSLQHIYTFARDCQAKRPPTSDQMHTTQSNVERKLEIVEKVSRAFIYHEDIIGKFAKSLMGTLSTTPPTP